MTENVNLGSEFQEYPCLYLLPTVTPAEFAQEQTAETDLNCRRQYFDFLPHGSFVVVLTIVVVLHH